MTELAMTGSDEDFINPERGYYSGVDLIEGNPDLRDDGLSLGIAIVRLDAYREAAIDDAFLAKLDAGFARVRAAGMKIVLRFTYNSSASADAPLDRMLQHIEQLRPHLHDNADVIAVLQAGFIGAWGEWHSSTHGVDSDEGRSAVLHALLDAMPTDRTVQIRTPMYKAEIFGADPISEDEAYSGSDRARVGHHNDCFLASDSDLGTYASPVDTWNSFVAEEGRFTPIGGETCVVNSPRTDCGEATDEMRTNHWSYLNAQYKTAVLDGWDAQGCGADVRRDLGYRLTVERAAVSEAVAPGGVLDVEIELANQGYAAMFNERPIFLVLRKGGERRAVRLEGRDARDVAAGGRATIGAHLRLPADLPTGAYEVALWLPDAAGTLAADPRYAVQLANAGVWDAATGDNVLTRELEVTADAAGDVDGSATELVELR